MTDFNYMNQMTKQTAVDDAVPKSSPSKFGVNYQRHLQSSVLEEGRYKAADFVR